MKTSVTKDFKEAISLLRRGELVAFPTETVYGLGACIHHPDAIKKIFSVKGRPADNPLITHVASVSQALELIQDPPPIFYPLADLFWPGPLTLIVPALPSAVSADQPSLAIRMPRHKIAKKILQGVKSPIAAPSANLSGRPSPTTAQAVLEDLSGKIPLIVDGGPCSIGIESTVLSLVHPVPTILRPGRITRHELEEKLKISIEQTQKGPLLSPGMKYRHYAPRAKVRLVFNCEELKGSFLLSRKPIRGKITHLLSSKTLYHTLREADRLNMQEVEIYCDPIVQSDSALMNRLLRAADVDHAME